MIKYAFCNQVLKSFDVNVKKYKIKRKIGDEEKIEETKKSNHISWVVFFLNVHRLLLLSGRRTVTG